jgi:hypothetical protein
LIPAWESSVRHMPRRRDAIGSRTLLVRSPFALHRTK